ncbi:hypothetical protein E3V90_00420 [Streptococcus pseudopneumoniae]|nr:hypothetical protein E3V84_02385 [Streptococcus pseudopneumoniae]TMR60910.1 hypothetical protein E3V90_00420 [Streptococcus pseudopneumoniae]TMR83386.1 hypothetical protein E3V42_07560 [Streptococcus pseudopneumoniae]
MLFLAIFYSPCKWFNRFSSPTSLLEMMKSCGLSVYYFPFPTALSSLTVPKYKHQSLAWYEKQLIDCCEIFYCVID